MIVLWYVLLVLLVAPVGYIMPQSFLMVMFGLWVLYILARLTILRSKPGFLFMGIYINTLGTALGHGLWILQNSSS